MSLNSRLESNKEEDEDLALFVNVSFKVESRICAGIGHVTHAQSGSYVANSLAIL